jgi:hypothetical protein
MAILKKKFKNPFVGFANLFFLSLGGENLPQKETLVVTHKKTQCFMSHFNQRFLNSFV